MKRLCMIRCSTKERVVFRIVFIYLVFGSLWIFFSDSILATLVSSPKQFADLSIFKGWAFILLTTVLLYVLVRNSFRKQYQIEETLKLSEERWKYALEGAGDGVWDWDLKTNKVFRSQRWKEIYGYTNDEIGDSPYDGRKLMHPDDKAQAIREVEDYLAGKTAQFHSEFRMLCKDGTWKWTLSRGKLYVDPETGKPHRMIGVHTDISYRKQSEAQITRLAHYDPITELPNRVLFIDRLNHEIQKSQTLNQHRIAILFLDLDKFKGVNDALGHDKGDMLLKEAGCRLSECVRDKDTVARLGGDEFTVILTMLENEKVAERVAQQILNKLAEPFTIEGEQVYITTSIGISFYPDDGADVDTLLKNADQAMYVAKAMGRNRFHHFTSAMQEEALKRIRLISDLRHATKQQEFRVYYQPIVELATGHIHKAEALIRWQHPVRGMVSPVEFIPLAEDSGMIAEIGDWVFEEVARQMVVWRAPYSHLQVSINKSPVQFKSLSSGCADWNHRMQTMGLPGNSIAVEITEGLLLDAQDGVIPQLASFRKAGIQIAIDDFGTGYSSLSYLRKFNIDYVKIDRSFTSNMTAESSDMALCEAIIVMAHKLGMKVIAEGIETEAQLHLLRTAGCDYGQGYLFSKPVPAEEFEQQLRASAKD